jgi:hypothetical protein
VCRVFSKSVTDGRAAGLRHEGPWPWQLAPSRLTGRSSRPSSLPAANLAHSLPPSTVVSAAYWGLHLYNAKALPPSPQSCSRRMAGSLTVRAYIASKEFEIDMDSCWKPDKSQPHHIVTITHVGLFHGRYGFSTHMNSV